MKRCKDHPYIRTDHKSGKCFACRIDKRKATVIGTLLFLLSLLSLVFGLGAFYAMARLAEWWTITLGSMAFMSCLGVSVRLIDKASWLGWRLKWWND